MKQLKDIFAIVYKNRRTSFAGLVCAVALWLYTKQSISTEEFIAVMGFCTSMGLFLSKDGQTQTEHDREHKTGAFKRFGQW